MPEGSNVVYHFVKCDCVKEGDAIITGGGHHCVVKSVDKEWIYIRYDNSAVDDRIKKVPGMRVGVRGCLTSE